MIDPLPPEMAKTRKSAGGEALTKKREKEP